MVAPIIVLIVGSSIATIALLLRRNRLRIYGQAWREYNSGAFRETVEAYSDERFSLVTRLANELSSTRGQIAVSMRSDGGLAIHHVNKEGTFSKRGPYYISQYRGTWRATGRKLLIQTVRGNRGFGFKPDHYNQSGIIYEKGVAVLEYGTDKYRAVSLGDFVALRKCLPS